MILHGARRLFHIALAFSLAMFAAAASAQSQDADAGSGRVALVIGNAAYPARPLATSVNDAGLVAEMVRNAGYDLVEARDADEKLLRQTVRDFLDKLVAAGPDAVAFVYLSGYGLQFEGENYFVPVSARLARVSDIPTETFRVGDLLRALAGLNVAARVVVLDMGRAHPFFGGARAVPPGLALVEPGEGALVAFSTGPGEVMRDGAGPYSLYAPALVEMATRPGVPLDQIFTQVRLRVHEASRGAITPWHRSRITAPVFFFEGEATPDDAPAPPQVQLDPQAQQLLGRPLASLSPDQAYSVVLERDTIDAYQEFIATFPDHSLAKRVRLLLAERREASIWRRAVTADTPQAYWSYLQRYPRGPHALEARGRLAALTAPVEPPSDFAMMDYGVPPPSDDEVEFYANYYGTYYGGEPPDYPPPPRFPAYLLPALEPAFVDLPPPVYYEGAAYLPVPGPIIIRRAVRPARPVFIFRGRTDGPRRAWRRPDVINRFGGQAPARALKREGPRTTPLVQPGRTALPKDQRPPQRLIEQQQRERVLQEKQKQDQQQRLNQQQRERVLQEKQKQDQQQRLNQQQRARVLQEKQKHDQQQRGNQQQDRERVLREKQKDQQRGNQQQQQRVIQQQQQQRVIQQQQQQRVIKQPQQQRVQPQPARPQPQRPQCPHGAKPDGSCR